MKTIIFSNIVGDVFGCKSQVSFIPKMEEMLLQWNITDCDLVYIDAPFTNIDSSIVYKNIIRCFQKLNIEFNNIHFVDMDCSYIKPKSNKVLYFLTGGNPLTQKDIIEKHNLKDEILNSNYCIGFCAGGMNLSKYGILTSDDDFEVPMIYDALGRVNISIEPHFNIKEQKENDINSYNKRINELNTFVNKLNVPIYAIPDTSLICVEDNITIFSGEIIVFEKSSLI